ncbi:MAG: DNA polymerase III subunit alpha [Bacteroidetes bacterium GWF2_42_66]|nr:MAG: DNA polymerase III subunit alpha [Bacteroidetes bacterium GWE2_42_39]OFY44907.1 MAG: DNA polymerase III subunit alpha [Bacteroidetes bacterium GWF2_42_66]HBL76034.1 DNA polymerase III subunit alpha [Prolixibacteraceae bacterium]HCR89659.1 DNA polymerase III subunit alpha [Prolixibacteraceae bacterium]HCU62150.1 DNA polymerase III subunit alpha [Prolixibacteraceae bacterium]
MISFTHLHVHSQYSILDGAASVRGLVTKAKGDGMTALALTDHGNMFGIKEFYDVCRKEGIKPILGCETYVSARSRFDKTDPKIDRSGDHLILLAKNKTGYHNLLKLISLANIEGFYYKPRIDKEILEKYSEGLIISSSCLGGEIPQKIMSNNLSDADKTIEWFKRVFGDDYYLELQRHPSELPQQRRDVYDRQVEVNVKILELAEKHNVKVIATNDVHFINAEDADAHDLLICLNTGKDLDDPDRMRYTKQEWFKTTAEMNHLFKDVPQALENTSEIVAKIEEFKLDSDPIMPVFPIPEIFGKEEEYREQFSEEMLLAEFGQDAYDRLGGYEKVVRVKFESDYLEHLTYEGAKPRYGDPVPEDVKERIAFELNTIKTMGFPGYFLITQDFINAARRMNVLVGPGRGSAAGSVVSYCVGITNIDPIKYDLLFERFLNPDRVSMPDVDIDFDDDGRQMVLDWVTNKYGKDKVAHICTFGTMATKMAIRDVARVLKLPLSEADRLAKLVPEAPKMNFIQAYHDSPELKQEKNSNNELIRSTLKFAETLEGSVRQTGVHACGVLISRDPLSDHIPIMPTKDEELYTTQYDGRFVESIGLLKMDFLGLKTLSIIKETIENIKLSKGITIDIDKIPGDDGKTFELFSHGDTTGIFQFESPGMKKHLRNLKPNRFEDLVAMNALYRPGPMEYIPSFINRKHGREKIEYDHPLMEPYLNDTYGVTVYQEQVMLQSRALANFTRGDSDSLRKAMGKKVKAMMDKLKMKFMDGCKGNPEFIKGCQEVNKDPEPLIDKIWKDWEAFASYAFNKSHSVCYAYVAYQTGYLKAHFPGEFMAANMSRNLNNITEITKLMEESKRMGINVLGPDVNESFIKFTVNKNGDVRFGMAAVKGVGEGAVQDIIKAREKGGEFKDIYDFAERVSLQSVNKKNLEALAISGAFDGFGKYTRSQFFEIDKDGDSSFIEKLIKFGNQIHQLKSTTQMSIFGNTGSSEDIQKPEPPKVEEWPSIILLEKEKSLIGIYLSSHPLDEFKLEINNFTSKGITLADLNNGIENLKGKDLTFAGMVTEAREAYGKTGKPYCSMTFTDYADSYKMFFFAKDYVEFGKYCKPGLYLLIKGSIQNRFGSDQLEFKVSRIDLLQEVRKNLVKSITLMMPLNALTSEFISDFEDMTAKNKGSVILKFNIRDTETNISLQMFSRTTRIDINNEVINFFEGHEHIAFKIN